MLRTQAIRAVRPLAARSLPAATRTYVSANPSPPPRQDPVTAGRVPPESTDRPAPAWDKKQVEPTRSNATMYGVAGIAAAGGLWYYFSQTDKQTFKERGVQDNVKAGAKQIEQAGTARVDDAVKDGRRKYEEAKAAAQEQLNATRRSIDSTTNVASTKLDEARRQAEEKYHEALDAAAKKYGQTRDVVERSYSQARSSVEDGYNRVKGATEDSYARAKGTAESGYDRAAGKTEEKKEEAKRGWFSWLSWGSSKKDEAKKGSAEALQRGMEKAQAGEEEFKLKAERAK